MTPARNRPAAAAQLDDPNAAVLAELRTLNRLLAVFTTRGMEQLEAITLLDGAGYGAAQIAGVLGINPVTVRTTLFRTRRAAEKNSAKSKPRDAAGDEYVARPTEDGDAGDAHGNA